MKPKELKTKISHAHSLILSLLPPLAQCVLELNADSGWNATEICAAQNSGRMNKRRTPLLGAVVAEEIPHILKLVLQSVLRCVAHMTPLMTSLLL